MPLFGFFYKKRNTPCKCKLHILNKIFSYWIHFRMPCFHSCIKPEIKIVIIIRVVTFVEILFLIKKIKPRGISKTISISNTKNIIVIRKNRNEKGDRAFFCGSNPHSKGDNFSRSFSIFFPVVKAMENSKDEINKIIKIIIKSIFIRILISK